MQRTIYSNNIDGAEIQGKEVYSLGSGEWSIEVFDFNGNVVAEFIGSNGTHSPSEDLHAAADEWINSLWHKLPFPQMLCRKKDGTEYVETPHGDLEVTYNEGGTGIILSSQRSKKYRVTQYANFAIKETYEGIIAYRPS